MKLKPLKFSFPNKGHRLSRYLACFLLFNEGAGGKVADLSGNGNHLTLNGSVSWTSEKFGPALDFAGGYLSNNTAKNLPNTKGTISIRVNVDAQDPDCFVELSDNSADNRIVLYSAGASPNNLFLYVKGSGVGANVWTKENPVLTPGKLQHLVATWNTETDDYKFYLDGVLLAPDETLTAGNPSGIDNINVGIFYDEVTDPLAGKIDSLSLYNRTLSAADIGYFYRKPFHLFEQSQIEHRASS